VFAVVFLFFFVHAMIYQKLELFFASFVMTLHCFLLFVVLCQYIAGLYATVSSSSILGADIEAVSEPERLE